MRKLLGVLAPVGAILLAFLICGMGRPDAASAPAGVQKNTASGQAETAEHLPAEAERKIQKFVVHQAAPQPTGDEGTLLTVLVDGQPEELTLRAYLVGVLMGEMPASYPMEALKAQAVAARTYTLRRIEGGGVLSDDPTVCQAYVPVSKAPEKFGDQTEELLGKLQTAVEETDGQVLKYDGALISATYFSCSGGRTESAQAVWGGEVPYLVSVESPGEEDFSGYAAQTELPVEDVKSRLGVDDLGVSAVSYTDGGGVDAMTIGGKSFSGTELRKLLDLRSTMFTMETGPETVVFSVTGYGHRVGMSQNGARVMAENGKSYREILTWYYTGAEIVPVSP